MSEEPFNMCLADMRAIARSGCWTLEAQVRAYDLLQALLDDSLEIPSDFAETFCKEYDMLAQVLSAAYDEAALKDRAQQDLQSFKQTVSHAELKVAQLTDLHECAKSTFEIWQTKGYFARFKALRTLRSKAGFRLEPKRIGNYVAKTYDLMNEARAEYARAQQALFAADMSYKIKPDLYSEINSVLRNRKTTN